MSPPPYRPGKTSPRLIQDLLSFDPTHLLHQELNSLTGVPLVWENCIKTPAGNHCSHRYIKKPNQTHLPPDDSNQGNKFIYRVSAICMHCRYHLDLVIIFSSLGSLNPGHLHHWVYDPEAKAPNNTDDRLRLPDQESQNYPFFCSYHGCKTVISVSFVSPYLSPAWVSLLSDEHAVKRRMDEALIQCPDRLEGVGYPLPITSLATLKAYIDIALHEPDRNRPVGFGNKRFITAFGYKGLPCKELLGFIGFKLEDDENRWSPPIPEPTSTLPYFDHEHVFLDDISMELLVLMKQRPKHEKDSYLMELAVESASPQFGYLLGSRNYERVRTFPIGQNEENQSYYQDLGVMEDMSNDLLIEAYEQQIKSDPSRASHYFKCLRHIGLWRGEGGAAIDDFIQVQYVNGKYGDDEIEDAYRFFQLDMKDTSLSEDTIIGSFCSRLEDSPDDGNARRYLRYIGYHRDSAGIKDVAENYPNDAERALVYLGVAETVADDVVASAYLIKIDDDPGSKVSAARAVTLIADQRKSEVLRSFINPNEAAMSVDEAYRTFQISDRNVEADSIIAAFHVFASEDPDRLETYRAALKVLANATNSAQLKSAVGEDPIPEGFDPQEWPVGLKNIGNTCYLNSLLQFYFTVGPFRNMVLHFEEQKMELDDESLSRKKVGSRFVSRSEIERAQKFVRQLRCLFEEMITSPARSIRPEQELARLTLLSSSSEAEILRQSQDESNLPVYGPSLPSEIGLDDSTGSAAGGHLAKGIRSNNNKISPDPPSSSNYAATEISEQESSGLSEPPSDFEPKDAETQITPTSKGSPDGKINPPNRPPPVPPRPAKNKMKMELEMGAQQDVTEVINNVLFQAQCAIKANSYDADGGQLDIVTELFYGKTKSYITTPGNVRCKEEMWSDIKIDIPRDSDDMYMALDSAFDMQRVHVDGAEAEQHGTISIAPPVLQIQIQRVQFDQVAMKLFKSNNHLQLEPIIYLDRYMDTMEGDFIQNTRRQRWRLKGELRQLQERRHLLVDEADKSLPSLFNALSTKLRDLQELQNPSDDANNNDDDDSIQFDETTINFLDRLETVARAEIQSMSFLSFASYITVRSISFVYLDTLTPRYKEIDHRIGEITEILKNQFSEHKTIAYHLYAVFIHRGSESSGHYWIYIFDFAKGMWREYNDEMVREVEHLSTIFASQTSQQSASPYFLVYVHNMLKERIAQPVCRNVTSSPVSSPVTDEPSASPDLPVDEEEEVRSSARPIIRQPVPIAPAPARHEAPHQDVEMHDAPQISSHTEASQGRKSTHSIMISQGQHHIPSYEPPARCSWTKDFTDILDVEW
ncbi:ubiquitin-specific protease ubp2 [Ophidiomyces ophidiicola]|uniref:Ubiquitin-specific protease ubp2 n=1 Tax=Ophidiomyces ophidiicola TaxID=1387563 RepID=A0ACB8UWR7_9EURO|nr:ubiquitin-specific protease ubp2 [Ophidiomyces ophidiicola]KAI1924362.1 ubiquitin-specific protease ubp2 [Ophidiomyces ophidiicola]KAI1929263.1 ubiquitin-specific protease ubp2 [Ophidiomyces ophidiicola]KAI1957678.1 ubiquitin-specific protease ubp2 [Ophidiomyces ophidiicola]KAI1974929.1 ubiquitin-specific protease ubp2 [Ophidiomyces ophidiicola]